IYLYFFFSSRRRHTSSKRDWSSDVCSSDLDNSRQVTEITYEPNYTEKAELISVTCDGCCPRKNAITPVLANSFMPYGFKSVMSEIGRASCRERLYEREKRSGEERTQIRYNG